jgi:stage V sporulation protein S
MVESGGSLITTRPKLKSPRLFDCFSILVLQAQILYNLFKANPPVVFIRREIVMDVIKVSATSRTSAVAGAIAGVVREHKHANVQAIGAGAVNQAIKALVLAKGYLEEDGIHIVCLPEFVEVDIDGKIRTAIKLVIEPR